ncbi:GL23933 [Drosophila persimilis]|uniref:GL23933 n=1 Tax=Drosophila persimilis TaxID=7234 RepID=B4G2M4_DROPE|nr:GL23933 [Drosophila persimilis]
MDLEQAHSRLSQILKSHKPNYLGVHIQDLLLRSGQTSKWSPKLVKWLKGFLGIIVLLFSLKYYNEELQGQLFNYWYFRDVYGKAMRKQRIRDCQFLPYKTGFQDIYEALDMPEERVELKEGEKPWYFGWSNCHTETAEEFRRHYGRPYFLPESSENNAVDWFFIGTSGLGAQMHIDNVRLPSWQAQLAGSKRWLLVPPPECYFQCRSFDVVVRQGDIIVLDTNKWYHQTFVQPGAISLTIGAEYD